MPHHDMMLRINAAWGCYVGAERQALALGLLLELLRSYPRLTLEPMESMDGTHWRMGWHNAGAIHRMQVFCTAAGREDSWQAAEIYKERLAAAGLMDTQDGFISQ